MDRRARTGVSAGDSADIRKTSLQVLNCLLVTLLVWAGKMKHASRHKVKLKVKPCDTRASGMINGSSAHAVWVVSLYAPLLEPQRFADTRPERTRLLTDLHLVVVD